VCVCVRACVCVCVCVERRAGPSACACVCACVEPLPEADKNDQWLGVAVTSQGTDDGQALVRHHHNTHARTHCQLTAHPRRAVHEPPHCCSVAVSQTHCREITLHRARLHVRPVLGFLAELIGRGPVFVWRSLTSCTRLISTHTHTQSRSYCANSCARGRADRQLRCY